MHCVHVPNAANGWVKPDTLAAVRARFEPVAAAYHHDRRDGGLSDHSALETDLRLRRPRG